MNIRYPIYEGVYRILTHQLQNNGKRYRSDAGAEAGKPAQWKNIH